MWFVTIYYHHLLCALISVRNDLYCVEWDVKPYTTQLSALYSVWLLLCMN